MRVDYKKLRLRQIDSALARWREAGLPSRPAKGWIRAIRSALGISSAVLGERLGMTDSGLRKLEEAEAADAITLGTLRKVAASLGCELQYALVPSQSLEEQVNEQALRVARARVERISQSMLLEDQRVDASVVRTQIEELAEDLLKKQTGALWR